MRGYSLSLAGGAILSDNAYLITFTEIIAGILHGVERERGGAAADWCEARCSLGTKPFKGHTKMPHKWLADIDIYCFPLYSSA